MGGYRNISISFWTDSKVDDDFTPEDKYFYLYLITNPHTNICGCYEISMKQMERETGYNADTVHRLLQRMENTHDVIRYSADTKEVLILNWFKYNWSSSEKVKNAIVSVAKHIKNSALKSYVMDIVSIRYRYTMDTTDTETVSEYRIQNTESQNTESQNTEESGAADKQQPRTHFIAPSVEDVENYCKESGIEIDAQCFCDYYESIGWMIGKSQMKSWKAAARRWAKKDKDNSEKRERKKPSRRSESSSFTSEDLEKLYNDF